MTRADHPTGTDRLSEAATLLGLSPDAIVVNVQGDEPLLDASVIRGVAHALRNAPDAAIATACHPLAGVALGFFGGPTSIAVVFAMLHGAGNGMITIAKGTLPLAIFGPVGYGHRQGLLGVLGRGMQALAPYAFGLVLERMGVGAAIALSVGLSLVALATLLALRAQ
jgi:hypothetical protein